MHRSRTYYHLVLFYIILFSLFVSQQALAEEIILNDSLQKTIVKSEPINRGGFIFDIQKVDPMLLSEDVEKLRSTYIRHQQELELQVENKKLNAGDVFITIIVPGGLLYAGYKKQKLEQAKNELLEVTTEIRELSNDLIALHSQETTRPFMLAQRPQ